MGNRISVSFKYNSEIVAECKRIPGHEWNPTSKQWVFPLWSRDQVISLCTRYNIPLSSDLVQLPSSPILLSPVESIDPASFEWWGRLYSFQRDGVRHILNHPRMILGDDVGLGKSIQAITACLSFNRFPILVFCPPSLTENWAKMIRDWCRLTVSTDTLKGRKPRVIRPSQVVICPYSIAHDWQESLITLNPGAVICDEIHNLKSTKANQTVAVTKLLKQLAPDTPIIGISATMLLNRPSELIVPLQLTRMFQSVAKDWTDYVRTFCEGVFVAGMRWDISGQSNLDELHKRMVSAGFLRRPKQSVLSELPPVIYESISVDLTKEQRATLSAMERDIIGYLREVSLEKAESAEKAEGLVRINEMRKYLGIAKVPAVVEWAKEWHENTLQPLLIFAWHREVQELLASKLHAPLLGGSLGAKETSKLVAKFQDGQYPILVASLASASEGLTLTKAQAVAFAELPWTSARFQQAIGRAYGRLNDAHGVNVYVSNAGYIDDSITQLLLEKDRMSNMVQTGNGDSMLTALIKKSDLLAQLATEGALK